MTINKPPFDESQFTRLKGMFRAADLDEVLDIGFSYYLDVAGALEDGTPVYVVYESREAESDVGLEVVRAVVNAVDAARTGARDDET